MRTVFAASVLLIAGCSEAGERSVAEPPAAAPLAQDELTPDPLRRRIEAEGAEAVVLSLSTPPNVSGLDPVWDQIATGDERWLALAPALSPRVDGETAAGLADALWRALPRNPAGVLNALRATGGVSELTCEATDDPRVIAAVEAVDDPALAEVKRQCLAYLQAR